MRIFLIGFMATGKTTVGRRLAVLRDLPFVDLDERVEAAAGKPIRDIFAEDGEAAFRALERDALAAVCAEPAAVVATGGGAPVHHNGIDVMKRSGFVVALTAPLAQLKQRVGVTASRPLLAQPDDAIETLNLARVPIYRRAHVCVPTELRTPQALARIIAGHHAVYEALPPWLRETSTLVGLTGRAYPISIATGGLDRLGEAIAAVSPADVVGLVSDSNVAPLYADQVRASLESAGMSVAQVVVPAGEQTKCHAHYADLLDQLVAGGLTRRSIVVAIGGGVVGDLAGFAAATLFRGVRVVQVPTTILAMVDSAIGGKTGINIRAGKNLVGAFWQPELVLADPLVLETLPARERRAAFGELLKYALLDSEELYLVMHELAPRLADDGPLERSTLSALGPVIDRCAAIKAWIVSRDEREQTGERALLNLGHTVGHAIEVAAGYGELLHGEAVALGLVAACRVSARVAGCPPALEQRVAETLQRAGLDADAAPWLRDDVLDHIKVDKKRTADGVRFVTLRKIGDATTTSIDLPELVRILAQ